MRKNKCTSMLKLQLLGYNLIWLRTHAYKNNLLLFHAIACHFLMDGTGRDGVGEKNDKVWHGQKEAQKIPCRKWHTFWMTSILIAIMPRLVHTVTSTYFLNDSQTDSYHVQNSTKKKVKGHTFAFLIQHWALRSTGSLWDGKSKFRIVNKETRKTLKPG